MLKLFIWSVLQRSTTQVRGITVQHDDKIYELLTYGIRVGNDSNLSNTIVSPTTRKQKEEFLISFNFFSLHYTSCYKNSCGKLCAAASYVRIPITPQIVWSLSNLECMVFLKVHLQIYFMCIEHVSRVCVVFSSGT